jgi:hypothetical protein
LSAFSDAYRAIESVILLRSRIEGLERDLEKLVEELKAQGRDLFDHERRLIRIETMIEMTGRSSGQPRIEQ